MPRKNRIETVFNSSVHHVVQRGVNKSGIFKVDKDCLYFEDSMKRYLKKYGITIYNYCLMPNHIHILLFTKEALLLSRFMQSLLLAYSSYYRKNYKYSGYIWQGRFKNFLIEKDSYLLECARYIERNPLRTKPALVDELGKFRWSSYNFYVKSIPDDLITVNPLYKLMGETHKERQGRYKEYLLTPRPYEEILDDIFRV